MTKAPTAVTARELSSRIDDAAGLLAQAEESFVKLATLTDAIHALVDEPEIGRNLARIAHEMAEELADSFSGYRREYNAEIRRIHNAEQSL
ncbi:hypothetical protein [Paraburkholderia tropica]|uniref:hypothetical protein n=1 Tax=Paraburkholderia tropica TaxID=92647 RepID=UPI002AB66B04|nr:hypothetical protein [Paraburkholderia tropica]